MTRLYYDNDADLSHLRQTQVAILGYGSQGHAHAQNLRDSGLDVRVGLRPESRSRQAAAAARFEVGTVAEVAAWADLIMVLLPDTEQAEVYHQEIAPHLRPGKTLMFAHGFNIRYDQISAPAGVDVSMVAPKAPGHRVRELYREGEGTPALFAIHQDASGKARQRALAYAKALGCTRAGVLETTFREETETDLFGEQAVLCGGVTALLRSGFETLVEAGYQPELAYFECLHELKLIVDLVYRGGLGEMWHSVSDTAEYGGYRAGDELVDEDTRRRMRQLLERIQDGSFAAEWVAENRRGRQIFEARRRQEKEHPIEEVGRRLRASMPFLNRPAAATVRQEAPEPVAV